MRLVGFLGLIHVAWLGPEAKPRQTQALRGRDLVEEGRALK